MICLLVCVEINVLNLAGVFLMLSTDNFGLLLLLLLAVLVEIEIFNTCGPPVCLLSIFGATYLMWRNMKYLYSVKPITSRSK